jgi:hypothetical protein
MHAPLRAATFGIARPKLFAVQKLHPFRFHLRVPSEGQWWSSLEDSCLKAGIPDHTDRSCK